MPPPGPSIPPWPRRAVLVALGLGAAAPARAEESALQDWYDGARNRTVPVRVRLPRSSTPAPVVLISHGLGGSRDGLAYLGEALAEAGFVAVHLQHPGSDIAIWHGAADPRVAFAAALLDVRNAAARLQDVPFALDELARRNAAPGVLNGRLDLARVAIAGHSFGAWTVGHTLGESLPIAAPELHFPDRRLKAGIELSPIPPLGVLPSLAYAQVRVPVLYVTGSADYGMEGTTPAMRTVPFRNTAAPGVLVMLHGAVHASFAGEAAAGPRWNDPTYQTRIARLCVLFLRAVLQDDAAARSLLLGGSGLGHGDTIESKGF